MIAEKDRNKVIGLVIAIVAVFAFFFWRVIGVSTSEGKTTQVVTLGPVSPQPSNGMANGQPQQVVQYTPPQNGEVEPFRAVLPSADPNAGRRTVSGSTSVPPMKPGGLSGSIQPMLPNATADGTAAPAPMEVPKLTGIVGGNSPIASFRTGTNGKSEIVGVGEQLSNGWKLVAIQNDSVTLANKSTKLRLRIGS